ncbi:DUF3179 domain-containing protein [Halobaculum sp. CBA1158]|uniref:DUF3179 domain-containing protein n=1 Tax=Halobaculum sp. CBA1158 TaxID=2904243 RepID=UPI001F1E6BBE|nr:DUF3179 domain-containing protein [Halobaculum sp. CBA1158]UIP00953.1 DUF3179 domain-containing protein [Halobaculum sp. CBA1158]
MNVRRVIPKDAIPSVEDPSFGETYNGDDGDRVVVIEGDDRPRAYPIRYLQFHEIVNDVVGGDPVAVTWCPLCGSAIVYDRTHDDTVLEFGVSGKLADDDLVMYDRGTESEWKQSSGRCIDGPLSGAELAVRPASVTTWATFRESYPEGVVLRPPGGTSEAAGEDATPREIDYDGTPYASYFEGDGYGLNAHVGEGDQREWNRTDLDPKTAVLGIEVGDDALGVPLPTVREAGGVVTASVGRRDVVVVATDDDGIHGYVDPGFELVLDADEGTIRGDGTTWEPATGRGDDGRRLERVPTRRLFAFAWRDDHGPDAFLDP